MSQFTGILRQITKKASHPNSLLYNIQLERAKQKYLVRGELEDGADGAVQLGAPASEASVTKKDVEDTKEPDELNAGEDKSEGCETRSGGVTPKSNQDGVNGKDPRS